MRDEPSHARAHPFDELQVVGRRAPADEAIDARSQAVEPMGDVAARDADRLARIEQRAVGLVARDCAPAPALVRIQCIHEGRAQRQSAEHLRPGPLGSQFVGHDAILSCVTRINGAGAANALATLRVDSRHPPIDNSTHAQFRARRRWQ